MLSAYLQIIPQKLPLLSSGTSALGLVGNNVCTPVDVPVARAASRRHFCAAPDQFGQVVVRIELPLQSKSVVVCSASASSCDILRHAPTARNLETYMFLLGTVPDATVRLRPGGSRFES
eukprot:6181307-Pleurochrysis_carterae.AAC.1